MSNGYEAIIKEKEERPPLSWRRRRRRRRKTRKNSFSWRRGWSQYKASIVFYDDYDPKVYAVT